MKNKFLISLFSSVLAVTMAATPVFADNVTYGNNQTGTQDGWYYQDVQNVQEGDPDGYVYGGGDTTGNYYAADIEDQYNQESSDSGSSQTSSSDKKNDSSSKKEDSSSSASTEKNEETASETSSEASSETPSEGEGENEADVHDENNPYETLEKDSVNTCRVSSTTPMPDGFEYNLTTLIRNDETNEYYNIHQYAAEDHIGHTYVPAGTYTVISITVDGDEMDAYPITLESAETFSLETGETASITSTFDRFNEIDESVNGPSDDEDEDASSEATEDESISELGSDEVPDIMPWRTVSQNGKGPMISYDGLANDAYNVTITITHSGNVGTAEYTMNCGYGTSEAAPVPSELKITIPQEDGTEFDTGLTVYFPEGDYRIDTVYKFSTMREWQVNEIKNGTGFAYMAGVPDVDSTFVYLVKIVEPGIPGSATYMLSRDNGETFGQETSLPSSGVIEDDYVTIKLTNGTYEEGDIFYADVVGVGKKDYSNYVYLAVAVVAAVIIGGASFVLIKKKAGKDKYDLV